MRRTALIAIGTTVVLVGSGHAAQAAPQRTTYTPAQVGAMDPVTQSKILTPLHAAAAALDAAGRGPDGDLFAGVKIDPAYDGVDLYLVDTSSATRVIADAKRLAPGFDPTLIKVFGARYTRDQEHAARDALFAQSDAKTLSYTVTGIGANADGSGLYVEVNDVTKARADYGQHADRTTAPMTAAQLATRKTAAVAGGVSSVPVALTFGAPPVHVNTSWSDTKWHDSRPFIAGDVITDGTDYCTAGLPAVRTSDNRDIMVTAGHCFGQGTNVDTGGGTTGAYYNGQTGNWVGSEFRNNTEWDMEELDQAVSNSASTPANNADESDTTKWIALDGVSYSYDNEYLCQDGGVSFFRGQGTPCGIEVTNQDFTDSWSDRWGTHNRRGVRGFQYQGKDAVCQGDSGALVFGISGNYRSARGQISGHYNGHTISFHGQSVSCSDDVFWTEAPDILNSGGLVLNPLT